MLNSKDNFNSINKINNNKMMKDNQIKSMKKLKEKNMFTNNPKKLKNKKQQKFTINTTFITQNNIVLNLNFQLPPSI